MTRQIAVWIACFAMLFASLAPSISHAFSVKRDVPYAEIYSVSNTKFVNSATQDAPAHDSIHPVALYLFMQPITECH